MGFGYIWLLKARGWQRGKIFLSKAKEQVSSSHCNEYNRNRENPKVPRHLARCSWSNCIFPYFWFLLRTYYVIHSIQDPVFMCVGEIERVVRSILFPTIFSSSAVERSTKRKYDVSIGKRWTDEITPRPNSQQLQSWDKIGKLDHIIASLQFLRQLLFFQGVWYTPFVPEW